MHGDGVLPASRGHGRLLHAGPHRHLPALPAEPGQAGPAVHLPQDVGGGAGGPGEGRGVPAGAHARPAHRLLRHGDALPCGLLPRASGGRQGGGVRRHPLLHPLGSAGAGPGPGPGLRLPPVEEQQEQDPRQLAQPVADGEDRPGSDLAQDAAAGAAGPARLHLRAHRRRLHQLVPVADAAVGGGGDGGGGGAGARGDVRRAAGAVELGVLLPGQAEEQGAVPETEETGTHQSGGGCTRLC